jgi:glucose/arabinose dehydrogenase
MITATGERGLLGLAFAQDYETSGLFYVNYTNLDGDTVIARYSVSSDPNAADEDSAEILLTIDQPRANHNGGTVAFGADGYLYIGMGDGGGGGDPDNLAQNDATLLGKMLRIDVSGGLGSGYSIPPSNPYAGEVVPLPEIWSKGWRNPYRFSFDRVFGDMYVGDVGQNLFEEVSIEPFGDAGGGNYGWRLMEGTHCFNPSTGCNDDGSLILAVYDYVHESGRCSITGGYVYRGSIPEIYGHYFFADFCTSEVFSFVWHGAGGYSDFTDRTAAITPGGGFGNIASFGEDGFGELYIVSIGGKIFKIVPAP